MKITTFDPLIVTPRQDEVIELFKELGFEQTHAPVTDTGTVEVKAVRMKHENGYHVDVADVDEPQDRMLIRMNVDNYDEAYDILISHGFTNTRGDGFIETGSAKAATMVSPSGFTIALVEHHKK
ncbi:MAG: hypothetical protein K5767_08370 [Clostridia bacterium]|nr:hypothetical protein [Clostridia bacterium]